VSGLNPKVFLLFLALLPQFTDPQSSWPVPVQILLLGLVHLCSSLVIYLLVGYGAKAVLSTRPEAAKWVGRLSGTAMILVALGLMIGQLG
jgi:threonine/homoserine/homoserine lactone efflux protein